MNDDLLRPERGMLAAAFLSVLATALATPTIGGEEFPSTQASIEAAHTDLRPNVLENSYHYHRLGELPVAASHSAIRRVGSYRYGFSVPTHRWGWFGAEHYYPRVLWHRGYYGDYRRWSYRRGY